MKIKTAHVTLTFTGMVLGGLPSDPNAVGHVNEERAEVGAPPIEMEDLPVVPEEVEEKQYNQLVFRRGLEGYMGHYCIDEHTIRGVIRESLKKNQEGKKFRGLWMAIHTQPYLLPFTEKRAEFPSMVKEVRAFRAMTPSGPRSVVSVHEALIQPRLEFVLELHNDDYDLDKVGELLTYAGRYVGIGAGRGKSGLKYHYGLFEVTEFLSDKVK